MRYFCNAGAKICVYFLLRKHLPYFFIFFISFFLERRLFHSRSLFYQNVKSPPPKSDFYPMFFELVARVIFFNITEICVFRNYSAPNLIFLICRFQIICYMLDLHGKIVCVRKGKDSMYIVV